MTKAPVDVSSPMDGPVKAVARSAVVAAGSILGLRIEKLEDDSTFAHGDSVYTTELQRKIVQTPGMITLRRAMYLYWLAFSNGISGDILEIGSWQGRSTIALAQGCADAENGIVHAVDSFTGNPGSQHQYVVSAADLSDLQERFNRNIAAAGLSEHVVLYPTTSLSAANSLKPRSFRLIYIDAEHTYDAVKQELELFAPRLLAGGILALDDYSSRFPGVVEAVHEHLVAHRADYTTPVQDDNFLVLRRGTS